MRRQPPILRLYQPTVGGYGSSKELRHGVRRETLTPRQRFRFVELVLLSL